MAKKKYEPLYRKNNKVLSQIDIRKSPSLARAYAFEDKKTGKRFLRLWYWQHTFNINNDQELSNVIEGLKIGADKLGWNVIGNPLIKQTLEELDNVRKDKEEYKIKVKELYGELLKVKEELLKANISKYEGELEEFKELIESKPDEEEAQKWLKSHQWVLGAEYMESQPIENVSQFSFEGSRFDFFMQRFDTFFDIIELKKPSTKLFTGSGITEDVSRTKPMSKDLGAAISQMIHYIELANQRKEALKKQSGIDIYKPRGLIIIGMADPNTEDSKRLRSVVSYLVNIDVLSYDMLYDKSRTFVEHIKNRTGS